MGWFKDFSKQSAVGIVVALATGSGGIAAIIWLWKYIVIFGNWIWRGLSYPVVLPVWFILIASAVLLLFIPAVIAIQIRSERSAAKDLSKNVLNSILNYTEDHLFGIDLNWRWDQDYFERTYEIGSLVKRCSSCHAVLDENHFHLPKIRCLTHGCDWKFNYSPNMNSLNDIDRAIRREIDRRAQLIQRGEPIHKVGDQ